MLGMFGPKSDKIGAHRGAFVYQETFKKDFATASRVINEVVLSNPVNKGKDPDHLWHLNPYRGTVAAYFFGWLR